MPDKAWHLVKKDHDLDARTHIQTGQKFYDWEVIALFYSALHYIDAYLATLTPPILDPGSHRWRNKFVTQHLPSVAVDYGKLFQLSKDARYGPTVIQQKHVAQGVTWHTSVVSFLARKVK